MECLTVPQAYDSQGSGGSSGRVHLVAFVHFLALLLIHSLIASAVFAVSSDRRK